MTVWQQFTGCRKAKVFSPRGFVARALILSVAFLAAHLAGLREYTSILNGTVGPDAAGREMSAAFGLVYLVLYMAFVVLVPILLLAAGLLALWDRRLKNKLAHE